MAFCSCGARRRRDGSCNTLTCERYRCSLRGAVLNKVIPKTPKIGHSVTSAKKKSSFMSRTYLRRREKAKADPSAQDLPSAVAEAIQPREGMLFPQLQQETLVCESLQQNQQHGSQSQICPSSANLQGILKALAVSLRPRKAELAQILWRRLDTVRRMTSNTDACFIVGGALRLLETTDKLCPCADDVAVAALLSTAVALSLPDQGYDLKATVSSDMVRDALRRSAGQNRLSTVLAVECFIMASTRIVHELPAEFLNSLEGSTQNARSWKNGNCLC